MLRTNQQYCVEMAVLGAISQPRIQLKNPYLVDAAGTVHVLPGAGGITYNVLVGDSAFDFRGDHIEPGASVSCIGKETENPAQGALCLLACIGNEAQVVSGAAAGYRGCVTGKHGGVEHVIVDFSRATLDKLSIGDRVQVRTVGQGLILKDYPDVHLMNIDPKLLSKMGINQQGNQLVVPVTHVIPAGIMGSGIGSRHSYSGDYDIQVAEREVVQKHGLQSLRVGDVIAIMDADCRYGRAFRPGAITIGVVVHGSCVTSGHGPGVTAVMTTVKKIVVPKIDENANIAHYLEIGRRRSARRAGSRRRRR